MKMKLTLLLVVITTLGYSQAGAKWATGGNTSATGEFLGTINNFPIDFKTNNILRATLSTTGVFKINNLAGANTRLLQTDANGNIIFLPQGSPSQVLYGNGTWGALPVVPIIWQQAGSATYYNNGFVGIGTNAPQAALDVVGDVKVSNNLYVGGGILISQKVEASSSMKTDTVHSTSGETKFTAKLMLLDKMQVEGATLLKSQFQVNGTSLFNGTVQANNLNVSGVTNFGNGAIVNGLLTTSNLNVINNTTFAGGITSPSLKFDTTNSLVYTAPTATSGAVFRLGATYSGGGPNTDPSEPLLCYQPNTNSWFDLQGGYISRSYPNNGNQVNGSLLMTSAPWDGSGIIEVSGHKGPGDISNGLLINYACGRNTSINTNIGNPNGCGIVSMGKQVEIGLPNSDATVNLNIKSRAGIQRSIQVLDINDKVNFSVKPNGYVYAREINVMPTTITFPDYVFAKNYKLMPLSEVENYVTANKHLPNIPSAKEVETNGINVANLQIKQMEKIEELYLHLIELKKENEVLKTRIESLEKK